MTEQEKPRGAAAKIIEWRRAGRWAMILILAAAMLYGGRWL